MRKLLPALCCLLGMGGAALAGEVTLLKFDKDAKQITVKEGAAEKTYKLTDKSRFLAVDRKSGESITLTYDDAAKGLGNPKAQGKLKFDLVAKGDEVVEAKFPGRKKK
jgi:hypothetical protein